MKLPIVNITYMNVDFQGHIDMIRAAFSMNEQIYAVRKYHNMTHGWELCQRQWGLIFYLPMHLQGTDASIVCGGTAAPRSCSHHYSGSKHHQTLT
jgi:hypothetical protein